METGSNAGGSDAARERHPDDFHLPAIALVGRDREGAQLLNLLRSSQVRLLTLTGPGGVGKTRLSYVARQIQREFQAGVHFVELAPVSDPDQVVPAIARVLEVREASGAPLFSTLTDYLRGKRMLLVLDNFEQVMPARQHVDDLVQACPRLKVLVTSRSPLQLPAEHQLAVPPLALPVRERPPSVSELSDFGAVALFVQRAREVKGDFRLTERNAEAVVEVCRRVDGLPLAIELVAAHVRLLPPLALLARLGHSLDLLEGAAHDSVPRHATMRDTIEWSYKLLNEREQRLFRRMSVFAGGCALRAAEAVCNDAGDISIEAEQPQAIEVLKDVETLVESNLLRSLEQGEDEEPRLTMLETVREYALEQLVAGGEADDMRRRHAEYHLALAERIRSAGERSDAQAWLDRLRSDYDNLRVALRWLLERDNPADYESAIRLIVGLADLWGRYHHMSEVQQWLETALMKSERRATIQRVNALRYASTVSYLRADYQRAEMWAEEALSAAQELDDESLIPATLNLIGLLSIFQGKYERARALLSEALEIFRRSGNETGVGAVCVNLGEAVRYQGDHEQAEAYYRESLRSFKASGNKAGALQALSNIGHEVYLQGDLPAARAVFVEALALAHEIDARKIAAEVLTGMSSVMIAESGGGRIVDKPSRDRPASAAPLADPAQGPRQAEAVLPIGARPVSVDGLKQAVRLLGIASSIVERSGRQMEPIDQAEFDANMAATRAVLGEKAFAAAWEEGRGMTLEEALDLAGRASRESRVGGSAVGGLTAREREVTALVAEGLSNEAIASKLVLSERTVEDHVSHALHKLGLTTRTQLTAWAVRSGLASDTHRA